MLELRISVKEETLEDEGDVTVVEYKFIGNGKTQFTISDAGALGVGIWTDINSDLIVDEIGSMPSIGGRVAEISGPV